MANPHAGNVFYKNGRSIHIFNHNAFNVVNRLHLAIAPDKVALVGFLDIRAARDAVIGLQGVEYLQQGFVAASCVGLTETSYCLR
jgi:hypothetical protein